MKIPYRNPWLIGAVVIVVAAGGWWWYSSDSTETLTIPTTETVTKGTLVQSVTGTGSVLAKIQADVSVSGQGRVEQLLVNDGDVVKADQSLLRIKSLATAEDIAKSYASLLSATEAVTKAQQELQDTQKNEAIAKTTLASSQLTYDKSKIDAQKTITDANKGVIDAATTQSVADTNLEVVSAETGSKSADLNQKSAKIKAQADVKTAEANLQESKRDAESAALKTKSAQQSYNASAASLTASRLSYQALTNQTLTAPVGGTIMNLSLVEGSTVGSSSATSGSDSESGGSSTSLFSIIDLTSLRAQVAINEVDIASVMLGQPATLTFDALPDKTLTGSVISIDRLGTTTSGVTTYNVEITLDTIDESIRPGMTASASIITEQKNDVLLVPTGAISTQNDQSTVQIIRNGIPTTVTVTTGASNDTHTEIVDGLQEGEQVITSQGVGTTSGAFSGQTQQGNRGGPGSGGPLF